MIGTKTIGEIMQELDNGVTAYKFSVAANGTVMMSVDGVYGSLMR